MSVINPFLDETITMKSGPGTKKQEDKKMSEERTVPTKKQVLEAAKSCPQAAEALKILFPQDFQEEQFIVYNGEILHLNDGTYAMVVATGKVSRYMVIALTGGGVSKQGNYYGTSVCESNNSNKIPLPRSFIKSWDPTRTIMPLNITFTHQRG